MEQAKQHWKILQRLSTNLENRVRSFLVIGLDGKGVIVTTQNGQTFWLGEMWDQKTATNPTPLDVPDVVQMAHGHFHILFLNKRGEIYSMGRNDFGELGLGFEDNVFHFSPKLISCPHTIISVRCGYGHSLALTDDGKVWAWGENVCSQICVPNSTGLLSSPRQIPELDPHRVVAVECGGHHSLALTDLGEVYAWGWSYSVQLGGVSIEKSPMRIPTPGPVKSIAAGFEHTLLLTQAGEVWAFGDNEFGQLGLPISTEFSPRLVKVGGLPVISQIASHHTSRST